MRPIEKFWWPLGATPSMCKLQCCGFCSLLVWYNGEQRHFLLCCRLEMGTPPRGLQHCVGISLAFAHDKPAQWNTRVKRAAKAYILSVEAFPVYGFPVQPAEMQTCAECGKVCRGNGGLRAHQFRVHGKRCESRLFAFGSVCHWCMTDFRRRPRLIVHFRKCPTFVDGMREYGMSTLAPEKMADRIMAANMKRQGGALFDAASPPSEGRNGRSLVRAPVRPCSGSVYVVLDAPFSEFSCAREPWKRGMRSAMLIRIWTVSVACFCSCF